MTSVKAQKIAGMMLGAAVGDALGWPQENRSQIIGGKAARTAPPRPEFRSWDRYGGTQFSRYVDPVGAGEYSDDTQLLLSSARSCLRGPEWLSWLTRVELPQWVEYQRGGGGAVLRAARAWSDGIPPWEIATRKLEPHVQKYFEAGANGAAMRIAPHIAVTTNLTVNELLQRVVLDSLCTHGHPRALIGASIHAVALRHALLHEGTLKYGELLESVLNERSWQDPAILFESVPPEWVDSYVQITKSREIKDPAIAWKRGVDEALDKIHIALRGMSQGVIANDQQILHEIGCFGAEGGSGTVSATASLYVAARSAARPMSGLLRTAFLEGADTDTIASMTASLLGALHGPSWLNGLANSVQDSEYLTHVSDLLERAKIDSEPAANYRSLTISNKHTKAWVRRLFDTVLPYATPDGRSFEIISAQRLSTKTNNYIARIMIRTADGQTMFIDRVSKTPYKAWQEAIPVEDSNNGQIVNGAYDQLSIDTLKPAAGGAVVSVELTVASLPQAHEFYCVILGLPCRLEADRMHVGKFLIFSAEGRSSRTQSHRGIIITLTVPDLEEFAARVQRSKDVEFAWTNDREALWLRDPSDNRVRVTQLK